MKIALLSMLVLVVDERSKEVVRAPLVMVLGPCSVEGDDRQKLKATEVRDFTNTRRLFLHQLKNTPIL